MKYLKSMLMALGLMLCPVAVDAGVSAIVHNTSGATTGEDSITVSFIVTDSIGNLSGLDSVFVAIWNSVADSSFAAAYITTAAQIDSIDLGGLRTVWRWTEQIATIDRDGRGGTFTGIIIAIDTLDGTSADYLDRAAFFSFQLINNEYAEQLDSIGKALRPTIAGRTIDIQSTGEADVNLTMMGGVVQSATDLKDFADAGYDPVGNAVILVTTTTTATNVTTVNGLAGNVITAASINGGAMNGKGDWNIGKTGYALTTADKDDIVDRTWDELKSAHVVANSFGDFLDDEITSRSSHAATAIVTGGAINVTAGAVTQVNTVVNLTSNNDKTGYALTTADKDDIADRNWDELKSGHTTPNSFGDFVDIEISGRSSHAASAIVSSGAITTSGGAVTTVTTTGTATNVTTVNGLAANVITAASFDAGAVEKIHDFRLKRFLSSGTPTTTTIASVALSEATTDYWINKVVEMLEGPAEGQTSRITAFTPASDLITFSPAFRNTPDAADSFVIYGFASAAGSLTEQGITDAVWNELKSAHTTPNSFGDFLDTEVSGVGGGSGTNPVAVWGHIGTHAVVEADGGNSTTQLRTDLSETTDNHFNGGWAIFHGDADSEAGVGRLIIDYDGATGTIIFTPAVIGIASTGDSLLILPRGFVNVNFLADNSIDAMVIAASSITSSEAPNLDAAITSRSSHAATAIVSSGAITTAGGAVTTVTTATNVTTVNGLAANVITAASIDAGAMNGKGDWNIGKTGYALTVADKNDIVDRNWDELKSAHVVANTFGDFLDIEVSSRSSHAATAIVSSGAITTSGGAVTTVTNVTTVNGLAGNVITAASINGGAMNGKGDWNIGKTGYALTTGDKDDIVDRTWDELKSAHTTPNSFGDFVDIEVSSRSSHAATAIVTTGAIATSGGAVTTVTNVTTVNGLASNTITAASIDAGAMNGKGDWNIGKTGYALTTADKDDIVDRNWDEARSGHVAAGSFGEGVLVEDLNTNAIEAVDIVAGAMNGKGDWNIGKTGYALTVADKDDIVDRNWDEAQAGHVTASTFGKFLDTEISGISAGSGTNPVAVWDHISIRAIVEDSTNNNATRVQTNLVEATDNHFIGQQILFMGDADLEQYQSRRIIDYDGTLGWIEWDIALTGTPAAGDSMRILPWASALPDSTSIARFVFNTPSANHVLLNTFGDFLDAPISGVGGAQSNGSGAFIITIIVTDTGASPDTVIPNAVVSINNVTQSQSPYWSVTDNTGAAPFNLDAGTWVVFTDETGFAQAVDTFSLGGAITHNLDLYRDGTGRTTVAMQLDKPNGLPWDSALFKFELVMVNDSLPRVADTVLATAGKVSFEATANANGLMAVNLWANSTINDTSFYHVKVYDKRGRRKLEEFNVYVPFSGGTQQLDDLVRWAVN